MMTQVAPNGRPQPEAQRFHCETAEPGAEEEAPGGRAD